MLSLVCMIYIMKEIKSNNLLPMLWQFEFNMKRVKLSIASWEPLYNIIYIDTHPHPYTHKNMYTHKLCVWINFDRETKLTIRLSSSESTIGFMFFWKKHLLQKIRLIQIFCTLWRPIYEVIKILTSNKYTFDIDDLLNSVTFNFCIRHNEEYEK